MPWFVHFLSMKISSVSSFFNSIRRREWQYISFSGALKIFICLPIRKQRQLSVSRWLCKTNSCAPRLFLVSVDFNLRDIWLNVQHRFGVYKQKCFQIGKVSTKKVPQIIFKNEKKCHFFLQYVSNSKWLLTYPFRGNACAFSPTWRANIIQKCNESCIFLARSLLF